MGNGRASTVQSVVDALKGGVKEGRYVSGQRLVESDLTRELGVSRGPLREALGRLAAEGLIDIEPYRGAVVRQMSRKDVEDLFEVREVLEGQAARLAAARINEGGNRELMAAALEQSDAAGTQDDPYVYMEANTRFHDTIVEISGNRQLADIASRLQLHSFRIQFRAVISGSKGQSLADHREVAKAILSGDADAAEAVMRRHLHGSRERALSLPDSTFA